MDALELAGGQADRKAEADEIEKDAERAFKAVVKPESPNNYFGGSIPVT
jgi:hypothetical protein